MAVLNGFVHRHLFWLIIAVYLAAGIAPDTGIAIRHAAVFEDVAGTAIRLPVLLLAMLLFFAGQAVDVKELVALVKRPAALAAGLVASIAVPVAMVAGLGLALTNWHDSEEARCLVLGLGIVAAMPVAGSSTAWSRHFGGSSALSIGLVIASTLLSPLTTPLALDAVCSMNQADGLGGSETITLLLIAVVLPSTFGMVLRLAIGDALHRVEPARKLTGSVVLLILCYANATASLPEVMRDPDWDYLALVVGAAAILCFSGFAAGWFVARLVGATRDQERSLIFGLGMTNNGTGLVLAGVGLAGLPGAMLPVIVYNLVQHVVAGAAGGWLDARSK
jgi:BASS family bile acid:Na+ symporter